MGRTPKLSRSDTGHQSRRRFLIGTAAGLAVLMPVGCGLSRPATPTAHIAPLAPASSPTGIPPVPTEADVSTPTPVRQEPTPTVQSTATQTPEPRTVIWWTGPIDATWLAGTRDVGELFTLTSPSVTVKVSGGHVDFGKIVGGIASGQSPDLLDVGTVVPFASRGLIAPLQTRLSSSALTSSNFHPSMLVNGTWRDQLFGIPGLDHGPELGLIWNDTLAGGVMPAGGAGSTMPDVYRLGRLLTKHASGGAIETLGYDPLDGVGSLLDTARDLTGQDWIDQTNRRITLANPAYEAYLTAVVDYYHDLGADKIGKFRQDVPPLTDTRDGGENRGRQVAIVSGYWTVSDVAAMSQDPAWRFSATWAPTVESVGRIQRVGGRLLVIPNGSRRPGDGWDLLQFLTSDRGNGAFFGRTGRFVATQSFLSSGTWQRQSGLSFFIGSLNTATRITSRDASPVASFAQVKWEQALGDILSGNRSVADALGVAQKAVEAEYRLVSG